MEKLNSTDCELLRKEISEISSILGRTGFKRKLVDDSKMQETEETGETEETLKVKFKYLSSFPALFDKIFADSNNYTFCMKMIDTIEEIQKGNISEHDASEKIGTSLAEKYVYTKIPGFNKNKDLK